jgi:hypothetical protein
MPEAFRQIFAEPESAPLVVLGRLIAAMLLGGVVALIYTKSRVREEVSSSFRVTLVLLSILIAMVTQVIGDNVARAFSLVGALSIVRFRTVVRDTRDTAFVIFAVAIGMAVGASHPSVALSGLAVVGLTAWVMSRQQAPIVAEELYEVGIRVPLGADPESLLQDLLKEHILSKTLKSISTVRQGMAIEIVYRAHLRTSSSASALIKALNRVEGVQGVTIERIDPDES